MKNSLVTKTVKSETLISTDLVNSIFENMFFWISIVELLIIICFIILILKKNKKPLAFDNLNKRKIKGDAKGSFDMDNLMNSINNSKSLYKELSRVCHPDRFIGSEKQDVAQEIFKEISKSKRDYGRLEFLKERARTELNINFKKI